MPVRSGRFHMKILLASTLLLAGSAIAAHAQSFTFTSSTHTTNSLMISDGGTMQGAVFGEGMGEATYSNGAKTESHSTCASWTPAPGGPFSVTGVCTYTEKGDDKASIAFSCINDANKKNESDCWGGLRGISGRYAGKTGTISWHQKADAGDKGGTAMGTGMWND